MGRAQLNIDLDRTISLVLILTIFLVKPIHIIKLVLQVYRQGDEFLWLGLFRPLAHEGGP